MKKGLFILNFNLILIFMGLLSLPFFNNYLDVWEFERTDENRNFKDSLSIDINHLDLFPKESEAFINDNFSFRTPLLEAFHRFKFYFFKVSPHPEISIIGSDGWLYSSGKEKDIYEGRMNFSNQDLEKFEAEWSDRKNYFDSLNIKCYWLIAPLKYYIYPEYLPFNIKKRNTIKRVDQIKERFKNNLPNLIIDPTNDLIAAKKEEKIYYKMDGHWTNYAAYTVSKIIMSKIKKDFPKVKIKDIPTYEWEEFMISQGHHYKAIGIDELEEAYKDAIRKNEFSILNKDDDVAYLKESNCYESFLRRYSNEDDNSSLKILFIRDSFCDRLVSFIKEPFKESIFINDGWQYKVHEPIIEEIKPDIVIFLGIETNLEQFISHKKIKH